MKKLILAVILFLSLSACGEEVTNPNFVENKPDPNELCFVDSATFEDETTGNRYVFEGDTVYLNNVPIILGEDKGKEVARILYEACRYGADSGDESYNIEITLRNGVTLTDIDWLPLPVWMSENALIEWDLK